MNVAFAIYWTFLLVNFAFTDWEPTGFTIGVSMLLNILMFVSFAVANWIKRHPTKTINWLDKRWS